MNRIQNGGRPRLLATRATWALVGASALGSLSATSACSEDEASSAPTTTGTARPQGAGFDYGAYEWH